MALDWTTKSLIFRQGLGEDSDDVVVEDGKLSVAENVTMDRVGAIKKSPGTDSSITNAPSGEIQLLPVASSCGLLCGMSDGTYQHTGTGWNKLGDKSPRVKNLRSLEQGLTSVPLRISMDYDATTEYVYVAWNEWDTSGDPVTQRMVVIDPTDFCAVTPVIDLPDGSGPQVVALNGSVAVYYVDGLDVKRTLITTSGAGATTVLHTASTGEGLCWAGANTGDTQATIIFDSSGTNTRVIKDDLTTVTVATIFPTTDTIYSVIFHVNDLYILTGQNPDTSVGGPYLNKWTGELNNATLSQFNPDTYSAVLPNPNSFIFGGTLAQDGSDLFLMYNTRDNTGGNLELDITLNVVRLNPSTLAQTGTGVVPDMKLTGHALANNTGPIFPASFSLSTSAAYDATKGIQNRSTIHTNLTPTFVTGYGWGATAITRSAKYREGVGVQDIVDLTNGLRAELSCDVGEREGIRLCNAVSISGNLLTAIPVYSESGRSRTDAGGIEFQLIESDFFEDSIKVNDVYTYVSAGIPYTHDGTRMFENSLHIKPYVTGVNNNVAPDATKGEVFVFSTFAYVDSQGNRHRSDPSVIQSADKPNSSEIMSFDYSFAAPPAISNIPLELGTENYYLETWMSYDNGDFALLDSQRITSSDIATGASPITVTFVNIDLDPTNVPSWDDGLEVWHGDLGEVINESEPAMRSVDMYAANVYGVPEEDPSSLLVSKVYSGGQVNFSTAIKVETGLDGIQAIKVMDDKAILLSKERIAYMPLATVNAGGGGLGEPTMLTHDTGTSNAKGVVLTPEGVMFPTVRGMYIITRGLELNFLGWPVQDTLDTTNIGGTLVMPERSEVRFFITGGSPTQTVIYNYLLKQWYLDTQSPVRKVVKVSDTYYEFTSASLYPWSDTNYDYQDSTRLQKVSTGWIKLSDIQDFKRLRKITTIGQFRGGLKVELSYDYDNTVKQTILFTEDANSDGVEDNFSSGTYQQFHIRPNKQKVEAVKITFTENILVNDTIKQGFSLHALQFEVGQKRGNFKHIPKGRHR